MIYSQNSLATLERVCFSVVKVVLGFESKFLEKGQKNVQKTDSKICII